MTQDEVIDLLDDNEVAFEVVEQADGVLTLRVEIEETERTSRA